MWVTLTKRGLAAVRSCADSHDNPLLAGTFTPGVVEKATRHRVRVQAPYIAWKQVQIILYDRTFGPHGGKKTSYSKEFTALQAITAGLVAVDTHPALHEAAMIGHVGGAESLIPVWIVDMSYYSPEPYPGGKFRVLTPEWSYANGVKITRWMARQPEMSPLRDSWLGQESTHMCLR